MIDEQSICLSVFFYGLLLRYGRGKNLLLDQLTCRVDWGEGVERVKVFFDVLTIERENTFIAKVQQTNERTNVDVTTSHNVCLKRIKNLKGNFISNFFFLIKIVTVIFNSI